MTYFAISGEQTPCDKLFGTADWQQLEQHSVDQAEDRVLAPVPFWRRKRQRNRSGRV